MRDLLQGCKLGRLILWLLPQSVSFVNTRFRHLFISIQKSHIAFVFLLSHVVEKVLFLGQIFEMEIWMDLHIMKSPETENQIFNVWSVSEMPTFKDSFQ